MATRRTVIKAVATAGAAAAILGKHASAEQTQLTWQSFPAGEHGFFRAPVLISGAREAVLIDGGFTLSDGRTVAEAIKRSGKQLTHIYISQSDPDYSGIYLKTGKAMSATFAHLYQLKDGKIVSMEQYVDSAMVQGAMVPA